MALTADYREIKHYKRKCYHEVAGEKYLHPITQCLVFATIYVQMGEITEKNYQSFFVRLSMWQQAFGPMCEVRDRRHKSGWRNHLITLDDVRNHIGLVTNVLTKSDASFNRHLVKVMRREAEYATL